MLKNRNTLLRLLPYIKPHWPAILLVSILAVPIAALRVSLVKGFEYFVDEILINKNQDALSWMPLAFLSILIVSFFVRFLHNYIMRATAVRIIQRLRNNLYQHIMRLSLGYFSEARGGTLLSRVILDVNELNVGIASLSKLICEPLIFTFTLTYIFILNWKLALLSMAILPLVGALLGFAGKRVKRYALKVQESLADLSSILLETVTGMRVIKGFNLENFMRSQFMVRNRELSRRIIKTTRLEELARPGMEVIAGAGSVIVLSYGGYAVIHGGTSPGVVVAVLASLVILASNMRNFGELNIKLNQSLASAERIFRVFDEDPDIVDMTGALEVPRIKTAIEFRNVSFSYNNGQSILKDFNLTINKGEMVALVGPSGSGKTTILSLIPRFFDPDAGAITIDGVDIRKYKISSVRDQMSIVTQDIFLFHDSIRNNIRAGNFQSMESEIIDASKAAQAWKFIERLPNQLNTQIGDRGQKLSVGECQRLSIARAFLKNTPVLLLDEATSALDTENEQLVQSGIDQLLKGRTALVVAHRLSTIRKADHIVVIEDGRVLEQGKHTELVKKNGAYARSLSLQENV